MISIANHLWQSTLFAAIAGLLTLWLRNNRAHMRYCLWLAASAKFLVPFSLFVAIGSQSARQVAIPPALSSVPMIIEQVQEPFRAETSLPSASKSRASRNAAPLLSIIVGLWATGCGVVVFSWWWRWRRLQHALRTASPVPLPIGIPALSSASFAEPGIVGFFRPALLLPDGIHDHLSPAELQSIVAHELCHVRRRDNLATALHMLVEAVFWFHPLVWWIGARLLEERERACDEAVLQAGNRPEAYAEAILKVCERYLSSPLRCVAGVTGANLTKRIEAIMNNRPSLKLSFPKRAGLTIAAALTLAIPFLLGVVNAQSRATERLAFEVASVRPHKASSDSGQNPQETTLRYLPGGRLSAKSITISGLIVEAYGVIAGPSGRLSILAEFQKTMDHGTLMELYDIEAVAGKDTIPANASARLQQERLRLMLQTLLEDRFKVRVRRETKDVPVYALVVGRNGPKLQKSTIDATRCIETAAEKPLVFRLFSGMDSASCHSFAGAPRFGIHAEAIDMADLATIVERYSDRPVLEKTGLSGLYKIETPGWDVSQPWEINPEVRTADPSGLPALPALLQDVGFRLESSRAPVEMFVVEHFERPAQN